MKRLFNLLASVTLLAGLVLTVPTASALADCPDGDTGNNTINCDVSPTPGTDNGDNQVDADLGNDSVTVGSDATVAWVDGDGAATDVSDPADDRAVGNGGDDTITINGTVTTGVDGDYVEEGSGGNDTIIVNGTVDDVVAGDDVISTTDDGHDFNGGNDTIVVNSSGSVGYIAGDGNSYQDEAGEEVFNDGNDSILVNGSVDGSVAGDGDYTDTGCFAECEVLASSGDDQITVGTTGETGPVLGDGSTFYIGCLGLCGTTAYGGDDTITVDGVAFGDKGNAAVEGDGLYASAECEAECGVTIYGGNDTITLNGYADDVAGDGLTAFADCEDLCDASAYGGNDTITIGENAFTWAVYGDGISSESGVGGNDTIIVNGSAFIVEGDGTGDGGSQAPLQGVACDNPCSFGSVDGGNDTIVINGLAGYVVGDGASGCGGNDDITVNGEVSNDIWGDGVDAVDCGVGFQQQNFGDDTITIGAGGVSYATVCQDISVTNVDAHQGIVGGTIIGDSGDGDDGYDTLVFNVLGSGDSLAAQLAAASQTDGTVTVNGQTYNYAEINSLTVHSIAYQEGAARMYDDGVTLAFAAADGIQVCNGPSGMKAGLIDYGRLHDGQLEFGQNGFTVKLVPVGSNHFEVHVYDSNGTEQIDDADNNGTADSLFVFGF
jgi:hypothetical protein